MELLRHRYRNLTALVLAILVQLLLLGYQVKSREDVRLIRVWAVTAVTPAARALEAIRSSVTSLVRDYVALVGVQQQNRRLSAELGKLKLENQYLRAELSRAERAEALQVFRAHTPSRTLAARIIGAGTGIDSRVVLVDRGSTDEVARGMAVITPDGVVGRVSAVYPTASQVVLITDPSFAAGVVSQKHHVEGTLKGQGDGTCIVDYIQNEEKVDPGEWFFTSGDDRVFPRGLPAGQVQAVHKGKALKEVRLAPSGLRGGLEEVLIVLEGVHQPVPAAPVAQQAPDLPPPEFERGSATEAEAGEVLPQTFATEADRLMERYEQIGKAQGHVFGEGDPGSPPPNFNLEPDTAPQSQGAAGSVPAGPPPSADRREQ